MEYMMVAAASFLAGFAVAAFIVTRELVRS